MKNALPQEMIRAIHTVAQGGYHFQHATIPLCKPLSRVQIESEIRINTESAITKLSPKEKYVFKLIVEGHKIPAIATMLHRDARTIRMHRENIRKKLGVKNDAQLILWAMQRGNYF